MSLYLDALDEFTPVMTKQALTEATRRFKFFPSIAELAEFLSERRHERRAGAAVPDDEMPEARVNSLARLAMAGWQPPSRLSWRARRAWEAWALGIACEMVRRGEITGRFEQRDGHFRHFLDARPSAPIVPPGLWEQLEALPRSEFERG